MPSVVPATTCHKRLVVRSEHRRRDLRAIAHFGKKKSDCGGNENAMMLARCVSAVSILSGNRAHTATDRKLRPSSQRKTCGRHQLREQDTGFAGERVVEQGRDEDAGADRPRPAITRGQNQREQLGLVADFRKGDGDERNQQRLHFASAIRIAREPRNCCRACARSTSPFRATVRSSGADRRSTCTRASGRFRSGRARRRGIR